MKTLKPEYICLACNKPVRDHHQITQADIEASQGATFHKPVNGFYAPLSPKTLGLYRSHDPICNGRTIPYK